MAVQVREPSAQIRPSIATTFVDSEGVEHARGSTVDIQTLETRTVGSILDVNNLEHNRDLHVIVSTACHLYASAAYPQALTYLTEAIEKDHDLEPYLHYYLRVCRRVLAVPLTAKEKAYEARCIRRRKLPKWIRWLYPVESLGRCKWCGHYTRYIEPNVPTFGIHLEENCCQNCRRMYPMPCVVWDGPEGRAYSYYRRSHGDDEAFYEEFEQDYASRP